MLYAHRAGDSLMTQNHSRDGCSSSQGSNRLTKNQSGFLTGEYGCSEALWTDIIKEWDIIE